MDKYKALKNKYERLLSILPESIKKEAVSQYLSTAIIKIWSCNDLYSPNYRQVLSIISEENYTDDYVAKAIRCSRNDPRKVTVPLFFRTIVDISIKESSKKTTQVIHMICDLFLAVSMINGTFNDKEADMISIIIGDLICYAREKGLRGPRIIDYERRILRTGNSKITEKYNG